MPRGEKQFFLNFVRRLFMDIAKLLPHKYAELKSVRPGMLHSLSAATA